MVEMVRHLVFVMGAYYFLQGMSGNPGLHHQALKTYLTTERGFDASQLAFFQLLITIPWMIKPIYGLIADMLPIRGYRMKGYFILGSILTVLAYLGIFGGTWGLLMLGVLFFTAGVGTASSDVICDKLMVTKGNQLNVVGLFQSAQWFAISVAGVLVLFSGGYIAQYLSLSSAVVISSVFAGLVIPLTIFSWKEDRVVSIGEASRLALGGFRNALRSRRLWGCAAFLFFFNLSQKFESAFFVYREKSLGFSQIMIGHIDTLGYIGFTAGTLLFFWLYRKFSRKIILRAVVISAVMTTLAYILVKDPLSAYLVVFGTGLVGVVAFLGTLNLAAEVCPKDAEGTVFALLMSLINISQSLSDNLGGAIYDRFGFSRLVIVFSILAALSWFLLPLVCKSEESADG